MTGGREIDAPGGEPGEPRETLAFAWRSEEGVWHALHGRLDMTVEVLGTAAGPDSVRLSAVREVLERMGDLAARLSAHLADHPVEVDVDEGPPVSVTHAMAPHLAWLHMEATDPDDPAAVDVVFVTDQSDPDHLYLARIVGPQVENVRGRLCP
jgi:hypothetical protein